MAQGDFQVFNELEHACKDGRINLETDAIKLALITAVVTPTQNDATPAWGASSGVDYDTNEVSTAGGYAAGGLACANPAVTRSGAVTTFDADNPAVIAQDASGFTDARWGILYSDTATNKDAIGFLDLGTAVSEQAGSVTIQWNASGIFQTTVADTLT
jgi:hypothetical protein